MKFLGLILTHCRIPIDLNTTALGPLVSFIWWRSVTRGEYRLEPGRIDALEVATQEMDNVVQGAVGRGASGSDSTITRVPAD